MRASAAAASAPVSLPPCSARAIEAATRCPPQLQGGPVEVDHPHVEPGPGRMLRRCPSP